MDPSTSDLRKAENEVLFRERNKDALNNLAQTRGVAAEDGQELEIKGMDDVELLFYCECSDAKCRLRIPLTPKEYEDVRKNSSQFILLPGHNDPQIERIVLDNSKYIVVEKFITPPAKSSELNLV